MIKNTGEGQRSHNNELMAICRKLLHSQTSYLISRYNTISDIKWHKPIWPWLKVKVTTEGQRSQTWRCLRSLNASCFYYYYYYYHYYYLPIHLFFLITSHLYNLLESKNQNHKVNIHIGIDYLITLKNTNHFRL